MCLQPTATLQPSDPRDPSSQSGPTAPAGGWKIQVHNKSLAKGELVQAWILRDDDIYGYPRRGQQSYFDDASYTRFDPVSGDTVDSDHEDNPSVPLCTVKRRGMINALGTGARTIVVGGVRAKDLKAGYYSAGGPVTQPCDGKLDRDGPDVLAVSDDSRVHEGVIAAGSRSGSAVAMNGTSVAAPQITRLISRRMAGLEGSVKVGDRSVIRSFAAMQEAGPLPLQPPLGSKARYGEGRIVIARPDRPPRIDPDP